MTSPFLGFIDADIWFGNVESGVTFCFHQVILLLLIKNTKYYNAMGEIKLLCICGLSGKR